MVIDQGGGSTEVSYFKPTDNTKGTQLDSINALGTVALENDYFKLIENYSHQYDTDIDIITHQKEYEKIIKKRIDKWDGLKISKNSDLTIHAYGIGGALFKTISKGSFNSHNEFFSHKSLNDTLDYFTKQFLDEFYYAKNLYRNVKWERKLKLNPELRNSSSRKRENFLLDKILILYGIPVYKAILDKFNIRGLRYVGFPLRYGIYLTKYQYGFNLNELSKGYISEETEEEKNKLKAEIISVAKLHHNKLIQKINEFTEKWIFNISEDASLVEEEINDVNLELFELERKTLSSVSVPNSIKSTITLNLYSSRNVNASAQQKTQAISLLNENKNILIAEGADFIYNQVENCKIFTDLNISQYKNIKELLNEGENKNIEFKSTLSYCLREKSKQAYVELSVIKTLAGFLNSKGGKLFIGISDDKEILGLENSDFSVIKKKTNDPRDAFNIHYDNLLNNYFGDRIFGFIEETKFYEWMKNEEKLTICMIEVKDKASKPIFVKNKKDKEFYIRRNGSTSKLNVEETYEYTSKHWEK